MPRVCYWNIAKVGDGSAPEKLPSIVSALRNFWIFWPNYYLFSEVSKAWLGRPNEMEGLASRVLAAHWLPNRTGYSYCVIDPHVQAQYSAEAASEGAAIVIPNNVPNGPPIPIGNLLHIWDPKVRVGGNLSRVVEESLPGVRRPVWYAAPQDVRLCIHHPSPTGKHLSFKTVVRAMEDFYGAFPNIKLLMIGDFNVRSDGMVPNERMSATQYAHQHNLLLAPPDQDTHDVEGKIDYVIHTPNVNVGSVSRLPRNRAASDHYPIYFDYWV